LLSAATLAMTLSAPATALAADRIKPVVVELFTSQGCYSCPPAEKFLGDLAQEKTILALEFHVDYWDDFVYVAAGKWKDPFSKNEYTQRQRGYNQRIRRTGNVYTPQMVIDGKLEAVGSRRLSVLSAIRRAEGSRGDRVDIDIRLSTQKGVQVGLSGKSETPGSVWLVRYIKQKETRVKSGENKGKALLSHNIVTDFRKIGRWSGEANAIAVPDFRLKAGEGCAVLIQDNNHGPMLGAAPCPAQTS
ncbi:MAG: DUF1223 domain-containing protein, partial [Alphaproteobacteria bacterium]